MEITAHAQLGELHFAGSETLTRSRDGVVLGMVEARAVVHVHTEIWGEVFRVERRRLVSRIPRKPGPVGESERLFARRFAFAWIVGLDCFYRADRRRNRRGRCRGS